MTAEEVLKKSVRYYVYLMCFLTAVVLFLGSSDEPLVMRVLIGLFFCLVVYRGLYKHYFMTELEREAFRKPFLAVYEYQQVTFIYVFQTIIAFLLLWGMTYSGLKAYTPIPNPYANLVGLVNGLLYSFLLFVRVFVK
jgi:hypothetical protein